jgi:hypothetical protein
MLKQETFQNLFFFNKLHDYIYIYIYIYIKEVHKKGCKIPT